MLNDETIEGFGFGQQESAYIREGFGTNGTSAQYGSNGNCGNGNGGKRVLYNYLIHSFRFPRFRFRRFHCFRTVRLFRLFQNLHEYTQILL